MTTASGGTVTYVTISGVNYVVHAFTESGDFTVLKNISVDVLLVAGGGGGGNNRGSGGGGGGLLYETGIDTTTQTYSIVVGAGGVGATSNAYAGLRGENSTAFNYTAIGGGGGARPGTDYGSTSDMNGGSGGGGDTSEGDYGVGTAGQGHDGGTPATDGGAGGGGAGAVGQDADVNAGGDGGSGKDMSSYFGTDYGENGYFAGGGGGGCTNGVPGTGGIGGGGDGGTGSGGGQTAGTVNTGGGGGGGSESSRDGKDGGSGIVLIRYINYFGYFSGYVYELGSPVPRPLYLHNRDTGALIDNTTSSGNGYYYLETTYSGAHYIVCLDDAAGESYNDLIIGNVYPEEVV